MERVFKKVITILNQNEINHCVVQEDISRTEFCMVDVYSVNIIVEQPVNTVRKRRAKKSADTNFVYVPILQIKHNPMTYNVKIVFDNECIYNNDNFQSEEVTVGYTKNYVETTPENKNVKKILDICKKKSILSHLDYLDRTKKLLAEQRRLLRDVR